MEVRCMKDFYVHSGIPPVFVLRQNDIYLNFPKQMKSIHSLLFGEKRCEKFYHKIEYNKDAEYAGQTVSHKHKSKANVCHQDILQSNYNSDKPRDKGEAPCRRR